MEYKAWNKNKKIFYSTEELARDQLTMNSYGLMINVSGENLKNSEIYYHIIPVFFSGVCDLDGNKIYEFDKLIIQSTMFEEQKYYGHVEYLEKKAMFAFITNINGHPHIWNLAALQTYHTIKIIGSTLQDN